MPDEPRPPGPPKPEEPKIVKLTYQGKPLKVSFTCTEDDITAFGMTCSAEDPCPVYLELSDIERLGAKYFLTGNFHNGATTMYSLLLGSEDDGKSWIEPFERVKGAGLEHMQFVDFETGWVSGQYLGAFPKDPFFLLTTDGGKNWRRRNVFSESRISAIEQFHFDSRTAGTLLLDRMQASDAGGRYERHETMTGGETWMVREVSSKPIKLRNARPAANPDADLRLRQDAASKSHVIEKRSGARWQSVAAFQVTVATCRPDATAIPEPPPTPEPTAPEATGIPTTPRRGPSSRPSLKK